MMIFVGSVGKRQATWELSSKALPFEILENNAWWDMPLLYKKDNGALKDSLLCHSLLLAVRSSSGQLVHTKIDR